MAERAGPERKPRGPSNFRQRDLMAAIKAAEGAGKRVCGMEVIGGRVRLLFLDSQPGSDEPLLTVEEWLARFDAQDAQGKRRARAGA